VPVGPVAAEDVWFSYPGSDEPALRGVSLRIEPREVVALVGANGSGKTTLAKLLAGLYVPDRGRVILHGADTATADRAALRRQVAVVFQDFIRYALPARDNIALGRHERYGDDGAVTASAERAGVHGEIEALRDGYATQLGPVFLGGVDLSLGQWQKVALARLFFRDAPFVILDEPTAALDARAEHELFARIRELFGTRSVLVISHRFSTVRAADRIHVLDGGEVIEAGSHAELMARGGTYAELFGSRPWPTPAERARPPRRGARAAARARTAGWPGAPAPRARGAAPRGARSAAPAPRAPGGRARRPPPS
jgi:ATP-binding cassette, subfamily B, bacterial